MGYFAYTIFMTDFTSNKGQAKELFKQYRQRMKELGGDLRSLANDPAFDSIRTSVGRTSIGHRYNAKRPEGAPPRQSGKNDFLDPVRFKKLLSRVIKLLIVWELAADISH